MKRGDNLGRHLWKLFALAFAYLIWITVLDERRLVREIEVPLTLEGLNPSLAIVGDRPSRVTVRVRAAEPRGRDLTASDIEPRIDLAELRAGPATVRFRPEQFHVPRGVEVVEIFPSLLNFTLERKVNAMVQVAPNVIGQPAPGYELKRVESKPSRVQIRGPESAVYAVNAVSAEVVSIEGKRATFSREAWVAVDLPDVSTVGNAKVLLRIVIDEIVDERTFEKVPINALATEHRTRLSPAETDVTVEGPRSLVAALTVEDIEASVDLQGLQPATRSYKLPVKLSFRSEKSKDELTLKRLSRDTIDVRIAAEKLPQHDAQSGD